VRVTRYRFGIVVIPRAVVFVLTVRVLIPAMRVPTVLSKEPNTLSVAVIVSVSVLLIRATVLLLRVRTSAATFAAATRRIPTAIIITSHRLIMTCSGIYGVPEGRDVLVVPCDVCKQSVHISGGHIRRRRLVVIG